MLSSNAQITPRPRPPAKMRRSSSHTRVSDLSNWHSDSKATTAPPPPPPYAPFATNPVMPTLLGSPLIATSRLIRLEEEESCENEGQLQEMSKEELEELLRRASEIIKERERELDMTSETCKALADNNASLKARNDSLISRLPPSQPSSPLASPPIHSTSLLSPSHSRPSSRSALLSPKLFSPQPSVRRRPGHTRRISSSPAELAALTDQNAELLAKLADLEAEASRAEQAGKRRLKNLEAEIENLRDELERTREESRKLEESVQVAPGVEGLPSGLDKQVVKMFKRLSREAKVRDLRAKTRPWEQEQDEKDVESKNFAPRNLTPGLPFTSRIVSRKVSAPNLHINTSVNNQFSSDFTSKNVASPKLAQVDFPLSSLPPSATGTLSANAREQALVSQLLLKIRELEETNTQLAANHLQASIRLREAQTESESVRRLCEFIGDEVEGDSELELELEVEVMQNDDNTQESGMESFEEGRNVEDTEEHDNSPTELGGIERRNVVRLRSVSRKTSIDFGNGSTRHNVRLRKFRSVDNLPAMEVMESPPPHPTSGRVGACKNNDAVARGNIGAGLKARKTVLGLFGGFDGSSVDSSALPPTPSFDASSSIDVSFDPCQHRQRLPSVVNEHEHEHPLNNTDTTYFNLADTSPEGETGDDGEIGEVESPTHAQSLGSELGLELEGLRPAAALGMGHVRTKSIMELLYSHGESPLATPTITTTPPLSTPTAFPHPQFRLRSDMENKEEGKREGDEDAAEHSPALLPSLSPPMSMDEKIMYPRLRKAKSSAVFGSVLSPPGSSGSRSGSTPFNVNVNRSGNNKMMKATRSQRRRRNSLPSSSTSTPNESAAVTSTPPTTTTHLSLQPKKNGSSLDKLRTLLLELWLWLYFAAVILVFIFSVARKGPKVVLKKKNA